MQEVGSREVMQVAEDEVRELAVAIRDMLNRKGQNGIDALVADMLGAHRCLQALFTRLCLCWLYAVADAFTDPRNAAAARAGQKVRQALGPDGWQV